VLANLVKRWETGQPIDWSDWLARLEAYAQAGRTGVALRLRLRLWDVVQG
jgi:hypothetical protein